MGSIDEFTVHLPSNTRFMGSNSPSKFTVKLALPVNLSGEWECALKEIHYPHSWCNVTEGDTEISIWCYTTNNRGVTKSVLKLEPGYYGSNEEFARCIEETVHSAMGMFPDAWKQKFKVTPETHTGKLIFEIPPRITIAFNEKLGSILGFDPPNQQLVGATHTPTHRPKHPTIINVVDVLYVYSDVVSSSLVGDAIVPLLRMVPVVGRRGGMSHVEYINPVYYPVVKQNFSTIEIYITDSAGRKIHFRQGGTTIMLHFRRKKYRPLFSVR